jgi:hypothetical protein
MTLTAVRGAVQIEASGQPVGIPLGHFLQPGLLDVVTRKFKNYHTSIFLRASIRSVKI